MKRLFVGAIALALSVASPARADWQFTQWGMSKEEFKKISPIQITEIDKTCQTLLDSVSAIGTKPEYLATSWEAGRFKFTNCYVFGEDDSLADVYLNLDNFYSSGILLDTLVNKYGDPSSDNSIDMLNITSYEWRTEKDLISFFMKINPGKSKTYLKYTSIEQSLATESKL